MFEYYVLEKECIFKLDFNLDGEGPFWFRAKIYRSSNDQKQFISLVERREFYRIQSTFPQNADTGPLHQPSDEAIWVGDSFLWPFPDGLEADSLEHALNLVVASIQEKVCG